MEKNEIISDGWHTIASYDVFVEDGMIVRGTLGEGDNAYCAGVYRKVNDGWDREYKISVSAFRAGVARGTIRLI